MTNAQLAALILSPAFIIALIALVRRYVPAINGEWVFLATFLISEGGSVGAKLLGYPQIDGTPISWAAAIVGGLVLTMGIAGGTEYLAALAVKGQTPPVDGAK